jgi:hypothetical protein
VFPEVLTKAITMTSDQNPELPNELKSLEAELAVLLPSTGTLHRNELMYRAGWEACAVARVSLALPAPGVPLALPVPNKPAANWLWPLSTAGLLLVAVTLGLLLASRAEPESRVVYVERPATAVVDNEQTKRPSAAIAPIPVAQNSPFEFTTADLRRPRIGDDYLSLRERVLAFGVEVLSPTDASPVSPAESRRDTRYGAMIGNLLGG